MTCTLELPRVLHKSVEETRCFFSFESIASSCEQRDDDNALMMSRIKREGRP